jgi:hypothetical protein
MYGTLFQDISKQIMSNSSAAEVVIWVTSAEQSIGPAKGEAGVARTLVNAHDIEHELPTCRPYKNTRRTV